MKFTSWGAAEQVTGSMHLIELQDGYRVLIDCGLDYEKDRSSVENEIFPFEPSSIDLVILTHAHIDHSGNLPTLVKNGYNGQILCTSATADLCQILLTDSVNVFLARNKDNKKNRRGKNEFKHAPLYLHKHVMDTMDRFFCVPFHKKFEARANLSITLIPAGHLLGAAAILLEIKEEDTLKRVAFSGDIGRYNYPILADPETIPEVDYLICESTYGGRLHSKDKTVEEVLIENIKHSCIDTPGRLIIPAFSIGRTQALVYSINKIFAAKKLPPIKVFVDSPLGMAGTDIYRKHHHLLNDSAKEFYQSNGDQFTFDTLDYIETLKESKQISDYFEPCIIISSAGMLEGGRIQDHLYFNLQNYYCTILFIGYCSKGTLGRKLLDGIPMVKIYGRELYVFASIKQTDLFSAHADQDGLLNFIMATPPSKLKKVFLVHGEKSSMQQLAAVLNEKEYQVCIPQKGTQFIL